MSKKDTRVTAPVLTARERSITEQALQLWCSDIYNLPLSEVNELYGEFGKFKDEKDIDEFVSEVYVLADRVASHKVYIVMLSKPNDDYVDYHYVLASNPPAAAVGVQYMYDAGEREYSDVQVDHVGYSDDAHLMDNVYASMKELHEIESGDYP